MKTKKSYEIIQNNVWKMVKYNINVVEKLNIKMQELNWFQIWKDL